MSCDRHVAPGGDDGRSSPRAEPPKGLSNGADGASDPAGQSTAVFMRSSIERGQRNLSEQDTRWSRDYERCIDCSTIERPHQAHGRCKRCDDRYRYAVASACTTRQSKSRVWQRSLRSSGPTCTASSMFTGSLPIPDWAVANDHPCSLGWSVQLILATSLYLLRAPRPRQDRTGLKRVPLLSPLLHAFCPGAPRSPPQQAMLTLWSQAQPIADYGADT